MPLLDLCYEEDVRAETDMNVVCTGDGRFVEVQGTAEGQPFDREELNGLLDLAVSGCDSRLPSSGRRWRWSGDDPCCYRVVAPRRSPPVSPGRDNRRP